MLGYRARRLARRASAPVTLVRVATAVHSSTADWRQALFLGIPSQLGLAPIRGRKVQARPQLHVRRALDRAQDARQNVRTRQGAGW